MRIASILAATASIAWLESVVCDLPVSRVLHLYIGWLGAITLTATFVARWIPQNHHSYGIFYAVMLAPLCVFVFLNAMTFGVSLGQDGLIGLLIFLALSAFFTVLFWEHAPHNFETKIMLSQAHVFSVCGLLTLASAVPPCSALQLRLRLVLGAYWMAVGVYSFCQTLAILRASALWRSLDSWFASGLCVVFLGGLAWALSGLQPELGPQHSRDEAIQELVWENAE